MKVEYENQYNSSKYTTNHQAILGLVYTVFMTVHEDKLHANMSPSVA